MSLWMNPVYPRQQLINIQLQFGAHSSIWCDFLLNCCYLHGLLKDSK